MQTVLTIDMINEVYKKVTYRLFKLLTTDIINKVYNQVTYKLF